MKRALLTTAVLTSVLLTPSTAWAATEHCPDGGTKTEGGNLNDIVPPAGAQVCVKGSTDATGIITADGTSTLS
jgi:hypothetical protein